LPENFEITSPRTANLSMPIQELFMKAISNLRPLASICGHRLIQRTPAVVEIKAGVNPLDLLADAVSVVNNPALREFLQSVMSEKEVRHAVATSSAQGGCARGRVQRYPIQTLRRAAEMAASWWAFGLEERDVLYVATLIRGIPALLADYVVGPVDLEDILFTLARSALHRLDLSASRQAYLLRLALGWGNVDEIDAYYVPRLQESVARALRAVQLIPGARHSADLEVMNSPTEPGKQLGDGIHAVAENGRHQAAPVDKRSGRSGRSGGQA
jgi:hypothetical protein